VVHHTENVIDMTSLHLLLQIDDGQINLSHAVLEMSETVDALFIVN